MKNVAYITLVKTLENTTGRKPSAIESTPSKAAYG